MSVNYITPTLINSFLYVTHNENADIQDFEDVLNKVKKPTTEAQQKGLDFEDEVYKGNKPLYNPYVEGGLYQVKVSKPYKDILLLVLLMYYNLIEFMMLRLHQHTKSANTTTLHNIKSIVT